MDLVSSVSKISYFEMEACESLYTYFQGGFKYVYSVITGHYDRLVAYQYYADEAYLFFDLWLQSYYLYKYNCLYSENFFSFTRSSIVQKERRLRKFFTNDKIVTLVCEVVIPYLRLKVQKWYQEKQRDPSNLPFDKKYLKIIPLLNAGFETICFIFRLNYLLQPKFGYFKPYLYLCNFLIRRKNVFETKWDQDNYYTTTLSKYNVFLMFLFVKYCQWYFSQNNANQAQGAIGDNVWPPPKIQNLHNKGWSICKLSLDNNFNWTSRLILLWQFLVLE